jgi:DNA-binding LacI/PurR family transcriptional regulator
VTRTHEEVGAIQTLVDSRCEVIILLNTTLEPAMLEKALDGLPAVMVGPSMDLPTIDVVRTDDTVAVTMLVDHLVEFGHTRIAHVSGGDLYLPRARRQAYQAAMLKHRITPLVVSGGETETRGAEAADELLRAGDITAITAYNDLCAIGIMDRLQTRGVRIPDDISVTGFDNDRISHLHGIALTTIDTCKLEQARRAVDCAIERVEQGRTHRVIHEFPPSLIARATTAQPPTRTSRRVTAARRAIE